MKAARKAAGGKAGAQGRAKAARKAAGGKAGAQGRAKAARKAAGGKAGAQGRAKAARKAAGGKAGAQGRAKAARKAAGGKAGAQGRAKAARKAAGGKAGAQGRAKAGSKAKAAGRQAGTRRTAASGRPAKQRAAGAAGATRARPGRRAARKARPKPRHTTGHGKRAAEALVTEIKQYYDASGFLSWSAAAKKFVILGTNEPKGGLVDCPECGLGQLMVVRSKATRKRFIGCSNYYSGCGASSPLLQKARLRALKQPCPSCAWPMVIFRYARTQKWTRQCSNVRCPTRAAPAGQS